MDDESRLIYEMSNVLFNYRKEIEDKENPSVVQWIDDALDLVHVGYFMANEITDFNDEEFKVDGDNQEKILSEGFQLSFKEAFFELVTRFQNSGYFDSIQGSLIEE